MVGVHFGTLQVVKIHPIFIAIHSKVESYEDKFSIFSL